MWREESEREVRVNEWDRDHTLTTTIDSFIKYEKSQLPNGFIFFIILIPIIIVIIIIILVAVPHEVNFALFSTTFIFF